MISFWNRSQPQQRPHRRIQPCLETLEDRCTPATTASFNNGVLTVLGDNANNNIVVSADGAGNLVVTDNGNAITIDPVIGTPNKANTTQILIDGKGGNDSLVTDVSLNNGPSQFMLISSPTATLLGGLGNDILTVGHGGTMPGSVDANGNVDPAKVVGNSFMDGGFGNDALTSGKGNDIMLGSAGNDTYLWPPGTLTDTWDGGTGFDTATVVGNDGLVDSFRLSAQGQNVLFQRVNLVQFSVSMANTEAVVLRPGTGVDNDIVNILNLQGVRNLISVTVDAGAGNDIIDASTQANRFISMTFNGGADNDTIKGGAGFDILRGDGGNDSLEGNGGIDLLQGGDNDDTLNGGDDNLPDIMQGGAGADAFTRFRFDLILDFNAVQGDTIV